VSPDGRHLAWQTWPEAQPPALHILDLTTGTIDHFEGLLSGGSTAWSPDGRWLIRAGHSGGIAVGTSHALRIDDGEMFELTLPAGDNGLLVLAPAAR
jgi:hypothetical protein